MPCAAGARVRLRVQPCHHGGQGILLEVRGGHRFACGGECGTLRARGAGHGGNREPPLPLGSRSTAVQLAVLNGFLAAMMGAPA